MIQALTNQGQNVTTTWQVVELSRPLMSVHQICERGNIVVFGQHGGYVMNLTSGAQSHFGVEDNVYVMELYLPPASTSPPGSEGFRRQGPGR